MSRHMLAAILCTAALTTSTEAGPEPYRCYGSAEADLAHAMLDEMPYLRGSLMRHEAQVKRLRLWTCLTVAKTGRLPQARHTEAFFREPYNEPIKEVADDRHIDKTRLLAALADLLWPPLDI